MSDFTLAAEVIGKIISGTFLTGGGLTVLALFGITSILFWVNNKNNA